MSIWRKLEVEKGPSWQKLIRPSARDWTCKKREDPRAAPRRGTFAVCEAGGRIRNGRGRRTRGGRRQGTLYVHFKNIEAVQMVVADELTQTFVNLRQPRRAIFEDPIERIADGCRTFLHQATLNPKWGGLVARYAWSFPTVGSAARGLLADDLYQASRQGRIAEISSDLGTAIVVEIVLQVMLSASEGNVQSPDVPFAVIAILQSLGVSRQRNDIVRRDQLARRANPMSIRPRKNIPLAPSSVIELGLSSGSPKAKPGGAGAAARRPECSRCPVCSCAYLYAQIARETAGAAAPGLPCALGLGGTKFLASSGAICREIGYCITSLRAKRSNPCLT